MSIKYFLSGLLLALGMAAAPSAWASSTLYYLHSDHLGSNSVMTDEAGNVVSTAQYYGYGTERSRTGSKIGERTYTGQVRDESTNLQYYNARYYSPSLGIFT